ncbi:MAG: IS256 family transposase [Chitinivibrionales bacterium]|nr:IS256 family transposase [Chitinivibrionales bacterium]
MKENTFTASQSKEFSTMSLSDIARIGAEQMLKVALQAEIKSYMDQVNCTCISVDGSPQIVRNGYNKERTITIGDGQIKVKVPRTRVRNKGIENYSSSILPKYMRRNPKIDEAIPILYLKGISTNNMFSALEKLLGDSVSGLSATNVSRMKSHWKHEFDEWKNRDLSNTRYCYVWVDGIYTNVRFSDNRLCTLVVIGATEEGHKELIAVESGYRESEESWKTLLRDLRDRGMQSPALAIGDGALGFWAAVQKIFPETECQRCWVHKTVNILDKLPKSLRSKAHKMLKEIYMSECREDAEMAFNRFLDRFKDKYPKASQCLEKDKGHLLTFYSYPAKHWKHIRTTNPIESTFATVRLRSVSTRGHGTEETTFMMIFKLIQMASKRWQRMWGYNLIPLVLNGAKFVDGELLEKAA